MERFRTMEKLRKLLPRISNSNLRVMLESIVEEKTPAQIYIHESLESNNMLSAMIYNSPKIWIFIGKNPPKTFLLKCREIITT